MVLLDTITSRSRGPLDRELRSWSSVSGGRAVRAAPESAKDPSLQNPIQIAKLRKVNAGANNAFKWAKQYGVKVMWGTDAFGDFEYFKTTMTEEWKIRSQFFSRIEQLQQATGNGGELLGKSRLKNTYQDGPLGVIAEGAYADILLVDGDPTKDIMLMPDPKNFKIIMKDGKFYKNTLS